jgi:DNA-binding transcriptional MerR regulator/methylmalonyl-CoA mutase cobalamin-binding subunit
VGEATEGGFEGRGLTRHSIGVVSRRTGLKPDVIRAWERRYGAVRPSRTATNRRHYSDEDVDRLLLLRQATMTGRQIGEVSGLSTDELRLLVATDQAALARAPRSFRRTSAGEAESGSHVSACLSAVENLSTHELQFRLDRATVDLSHQCVLEDVLIPLLEKIGHLWEEGKLRIAHEHMASNVIGAYLGTVRLSFGATDNAPPLIVGTPVRQHHELGALIAAAAAASEGWRVTFLGANLPAEELAAAARQTAARAIALSLVYPGDDPHLERELIRLRRLLGQNVHLIVGGRSSARYESVLHRVSAIPVSDIRSFRPVLRDLRR